MEKSEISWTDGTLNFWEGCTKISDGCRYCYAEDRDRRWHGGEHWGKGAPRIKSKSALKNLLKMDRGAKAGRFVRHVETGVRGWLGDPELPFGPTAIARPILFSLSLGDIFDAEVDPAWLAEALNAAIMADGVDFMFLTKRPEAWGERMSAAVLAAATPAVAARLRAWMEGEAPPNIAFGATVEGPKVRARIGHVLEIPVVRRFLSMEPLLGDPSWLLENPAVLNGIDLVIAGGESGNQARPMFPEWPFIIEQACDEAGVAYHFKQWGEWVPERLKPFPPQLPRKGNSLRVKLDGTFAMPDEAGENVWRVGKKAAGHALTLAGRTRTEILAFPLAAWRGDWFEMPPVGIFPARRFADLRFAREFAAIHPEAADSIKPTSWDGRTIPAE
jgi:protein gp37